MYLRRSIWIVYLLLATVSIPWYWWLVPQAMAIRPVIGLPLWVFVSICGSAIISCYTCWLLMRSWPGEAEELEQ